MNILESLTDAYAPIRPASVRMSDGGFMHYWVGHIGMGVEDVALVSPQIEAELNALIDAKKVTIAHKRFVAALGHEMCFWQLNLDSAIPMTKEIKESLESYARGVTFDLDRPLDDQDD